MKTDSSFTRHCAVTHTEWSSFVGTRFKERGTFQRGGKHGPTHVGAGHRATTRARARRSCVAHCSRGNSGARRLWGAFVTRAKGTTAREWGRGGVNAGVGHVLVPSTHRGRRDSVVALRHVANLNLIHSRSVCRRTEPRDAPSSVQRVQPAAPGLCAKRCQAVEVG